MSLRRQPGFAGWDKGQESGTGTTSREHESPGHGYATGFGGQESGAGARSLGHESPGHGYATGFGGA